VEFATPVGGRYSKFEYGYSKIKGSGVIGIGLEFVGKHVTITPEVRFDHNVTRALVGFTFGQRR
jgi:hypothetical protein